MPNENPPAPILEEVARATATLESLLAQPGLWAALPEDSRLALMKAAGRVSRPSKADSDERNKAIRKAKRAMALERDRAERQKTGIRDARSGPVFTAPKQLDFGEARPGRERVLSSPRDCYICKAKFTRLHFFYDQLCEACGDLNYRKRFVKVPLHGRTALLTGGRVKIGFHVARMLLEQGARVVVTTRFPVDAAARFAREPGFQEWGERLEVYGLDLRHTPSVEIFCRLMGERLGRLDLLINNAAQTVRRPPGFYRHLMAGETLPYGEQPGEIRQILSGHHELLGRLGLRSPAPSSELPVSWQASAPGLGLRDSARLSQIPYSFEPALPPEAIHEVFPEGKLDADLQQVDLRATNSWRLRLGEVSTHEMLEVQLVNAVAPFVLCGGLAPLMRRDPTGDKHIVNVTAIEGKFFRFTKPDRHPHTNMAKAALNMLTHTSGSDLAKDGIHMNAVDTGWVTDEDPAAMVAEKQAHHDFQPPLDIVDGAARIVDPFFDGILTGKHWVGKFLKDYAPIDW